METNVENMAGIKNKHREKSFLLLIILLYISIFPAFSQQEEKKVGLVLSGGGALGIAHIGVLKMIEKYDIPVDYITGTSMGAIIGALYASGYKASEIEEIIRSVNWLPLLSDKKERKTIDLNDKELYEKNIFMLHFNKGKLTIPEGAVYGQNVYNLISSLTWHVREVEDFSDLPIPFKCVATDIQTGEAVVLDKGNLADAVRASMAIPTVFSPIEINNRLLVDGGVVRNIPVSDIKEMGADIIIVSDVTTPYYTKEELKSLLAVFDQLIKVAFSPSDEYELSLADRVITYDLKDYNIASFLQTDEILEKGDEALPDNENYFKSLAAELGRKRKTEKPEGENITIRNIEIKGNTRNDETKILRLMGIENNTAITKEKLEKGIALLYGTGDFNLIRYTVRNNTLSLDLNEAPPELNTFSINYNNYDGASLLVNSKAEGVFLEDSTARFRLKLGRNYLAGLNYSIPVLNDYFKLDAGGSLFRRDFYSYNEKGDKESRIFSDFYTVSTALEYDYFRNLKTGCFYDYNFITYKDEISPDDIDEDIAYFNTGVYLKIDTSDKTLFPDRGVLLYCSGEYVSFNDYFSSSLLSEEKNVTDYFQIKAKSELYIPIFSFITLTPSVEAGISDFTGRDSAGFFTGGFKDDIDNNFISFKGLYPGDIMEENIVSSEIALNIHLNRLLVLSPFYSRLFYSFPDNTETLYSFGASLSLITPLGPIEAAAAKAESKELPVLYINIGFSF